MRRPPLDLEAEFRRLFSEHYRHVLAYALRRTEQRADAEDAVAGKFAVAWRRFRDAPAQELQLACSIWSGTLSPSDWEGGCADTPYMITVRVSPAAPTREGLGRVGRVRLVRVSLGLVGAAATRRATVER